MKLEVRTFSLTDSVLATAAVPLKAAPPQTGPGCNLEHVVTSTWSGSSSAHPICRGLEVPREHRCPLLMVQEQSSLQSR